MSEATERRKLKRWVKRIAARYSCGAVTGAGHVKNLSKEGLFLRAESLPEVGQPIRVVIQAESGKKIEIHGTVRWTTAQLPNSEDVPTGFGVRIDDPTDAYREFFEDLLCG